MNMNLCIFKLKEFFVSTGILDFLGPAVLTIGIGRNKIYQKNNVVNVPIKNGMSLKLKSYSFDVSTQLHKSIARKLYKAQQNKLSSLISV